MGGPANPGEPGNRAVKPYVCVCSSLLLFPQLHHSTMFLYAVVDLCSCRKLPLLSLAKHSSLQSPWYLHLKLQTPQLLMTLQPQQIPFLHSSRSISKLSVSAHTFS